MKSLRNKGLVAKALVAKQAATGLVFRDSKASTNLRMGMTEVGAAIAVARLVADAGIVLQNAPALGLVLRGRRSSSSQHLIVGFHARSVTRAQALQWCGR
jgi:hypothetical protein